MKTACPEVTCPGAVTLPGRCCKTCPGDPGTGILGVGPAEKQPKETDVQVSKDTLSMDQGRAHYTSMHKTHDFLTKYICPYLYMLN